MDAIPWFWIWIIIAAALFIGEMLTLSFFLLPFAVGAVLAAIASAVGLDLLWQIIVFIAGSILSLIALRPLAKRLTRKGGSVKVGAERLVGMQGKVIEGSTKAGEIRVVVGGEPWNARTEDAEQLALDTPIEVLAVNGNSLLVKRML